MAKNNKNEEVLEDELPDELDESVESEEVDEDEVLDDESEPDEGADAEPEAELSDESDPADENIFYVHKIFALTQGNTYTSFEANQKVDVNKFTGDDRKVIDSLIKDGSLKRTPYTR